MPLPKPKSKEKERKFLSRCMDNDVMKKEYEDSKQRLAVCYSQWRKKSKSEVNIMSLRKKLEERLSGKKKVIKVEEIEVSTKSWASINKSKLPASCFLWVSGTKNRLPYREGAGEVDVKTGMYKEAGPVNINAVRSIISALAGARTGERMSVPASVKKKAEALAKKYKIDKYKESMFGMKYMIVT